MASSCVRWILAPSPVLARGARGDARHSSVVARAGAGDNPFANLRALRGTLPDKPELASRAGTGGGGEEGSSRSSGGRAGDGRMSMEEAIAEVGKGSMRAERKAASSSSKGGSPPSKGGGIGSGTGASKGMDVAEQQVRVGVTRAGKKGKSVTCVDGMDVGTAEEARELVKKFKRVLGVGGVATANGSLQFQGDNAAVLVEMLVAMGYKRTKQTGGVVVKRK